jgi:hypothetical protein
MLRFKVGSYTPNTPDTFEADLLAWLNANGKISTTNGRGLEVIQARHKSQPGSNLMKVAEALNKAPRPISETKLRNRLTDMTDKQIHSALMKMRQNGEVLPHPRQTGGTKFYLYSLTDDGKAKWEERIEDFENGKPVALEIWRAFKTQGLKRGQGVEPMAVRKAMRSTMKEAEFWAGWRTLVASGRLDVAYNAEGRGKHIYLIA